VKQAVDDLSSTEEEAVYEANQFFQSRSGGWAKMRRFYFDLLGLDEDAVLARLKPLLTTPERPEKKWTGEQIYAILPRREFSAKEIANRTSISYTRTTARLQHLLTQERIMRIDRGVYVRDDFYDEWVDEQIALQPALEPEAATRTTHVTMLLRDGPKTIRELGIAYDGELGQEAIRQRLIRAQAAGRVERDGPAWRLAA
jgi:hypothetical protein